SRYYFTHFWNFVYGYRWAFNYVGGPIFATIDFATWDVHPPAPAGTPFSLTADYKLDPSKTLPHNYTITIVLFDVEVARIACAVAFVGSCSSCLLQA
ncbi:23863_t:CDS:1, partial [Gigaspora rosea]